jgi:glutamate racemase
MASGRIGVFDSGLGGLTVLRALLDDLPGYDYLFLADSARNPYGARSLDVIYGFTLEAVEYLFDQGCPLVVLACNTASARALRSIQQQHLPVRRPDRRVLGMVRPSAEALAGLPPGALPGITPPAMAEGVVAVLGTQTTVASDSYRIELEKLAPRLRLVQQACPLWVPLVEAGELDGPGVDWYVHRYLDPLFAAPDPPEKILLACTHYPLLLPRIEAAVPDGVQVLSQARIVSERLRDWLVRHPETESRLSHGGGREFATTDDPAWFSERGGRMLGTPFEARRVRLSPVS